MLDRVALLAACTGRGESIPSDELADIGPAIQASRAALVGIVAGLAIADLCEELRRARESIAKRGERAEGAPAEFAERRTYAAATRR